MAIDKAVDSAVLDAGLKAIADAIREKAGTSDVLAFPEGMAEAIAGIQTGGDYEVVTGTFTTTEAITSGNYVLSDRLQCPKYAMISRTVDVTGSATVFYCGCADASNFNSCMGKKNYSVTGILGSGGLEIIRECHLYYHQARGGFGFCAGSTYPLDGTYVWVAIY